MNTNPRAPLAESDLKTVLIAGAGNIGSGLPTMIGRIPNIGKVLFVDPQVYEEKNLRGQDISRSDVGKPKALVQARRLRRVNPAIDARAFCERIEDLPLGVMQVDSILSCVDSWGVRQYINQGAWHLGVPWIDAAVDASGLLVRVNVYLPGADSICAECGWDEEDYRHQRPGQPGIDRGGPDRHGMPEAPLRRPRALVGGPAGHARSPRSYALRHGLQADPLPIQPRNLGRRAARGVAGGGHARPGARLGRQRVGQRGRLRAARGRSTVCTDAVLSGVREPRDDRTLPGPPHPPGAATLSGLRRRDGGPRV